MYRQVLFALCLYIYTAVKVPRPALTKISCKEYGYVQRVAKVVLWVVGCWLCLAGCKKW